MAQAAGLDLMEELKGFSISSLWLLLLKQNLCVRPHISPFPCFYLSHYPSCSNSIRPVGFQFMQKIRSASFLSDINEERTIWFKNETSVLVCANYHVRTIMGFCFLTDLTFLHFQKPYKKSIGYLVEARSWLTIITRTFHWTKQERWLVDSYRGRQMAGRLPADVGHGDAFRVC